MAWTAPEVDRPDWPWTGEERAQLEALLDWHHRTLLMKCSGLTADQLKLRSLPSAELSLLGLIRHLTDVERSWFWRLAGKVAPLHWTEDELAGRIEEPWAEFTEVPDADAETDMAAYLETCQGSRDLVLGRALDEPFTTPGGRTFSLRWIYLHMIEEYARHNGHADLLRQHIDGATGE